MKRFWLVLLSLGLVMAFSASAMAVDVKFSGAFIVGGMYLDKNQVQDKANYSGTTFWKTTGTGTTLIQGTNYIGALGTPVDIASTAFYFQQLRVTTEFVVAPGLSAVTRATIMDRVWGGARIAAGTASAYDTSTTGLPGGSQSAGTLAENQNIAFDYAYIKYASPIGLFLIGYQADNVWGTRFGDNESANARITYVLPMGNLTLIGVIAKMGEGSVAASANATNAAVWSTGQSDTGESDKYNVAVKYAWKGGEAGLLGGYWRYTHFKNSTMGSVMPLLAPMTATWVGALPYVKAKVGPVSVEAEFIWLNGDIKYEENRRYMTGIAGHGNGYDTVKVDNNMGAYVDATVDLGQVYFGGMFAWVRGDDPSTFDKKEGVLVGTGRDLDPTLILFSADRYKYNYDLRGQYTGPGATSSSSYASTSFQMTNGLLFQGKVGVKPTEKIDILAKVSYAIVDKRPWGTIAGANNGVGAGLAGYESAALAYVGDTYGTELDVTASFKVTNNLTYMLGGGYLWTGNYFKGYQATAEPANDYLIINKLTLTF